MDGGVLQIVVQACVGVIMAWAGWTVRRELARNEAAHREMSKAHAADRDALRCEMAELVKALAAEREARNSDYRAQSQAIQGVTDRVWEVHKTMAADYATEERVMSQHGMVVQMLNDLSGQMNRLVGRFEATSEKTGG